VPQADEDNNSRSKLARPEVLNAGEDNNATSKLAIQAPPHAGEDNNAGSKLANPAAVDDGGNNTKEGKSDVARGEGGENIAATVSNGGALSETSKKSTSDGGASHDAVKDAPAAVAGGGKGKGKGVEATEMDHALHIWTERERRKKMKNMFSTLHALLPQLPEKASTHARLFSFLRFHVG
jgi:hypothetical protein